MSSKSIQHRSYRSQPLYQLSRANLPHVPQYPVTNDPKTLLRNSVKQTKKLTNSRKSRNRRKIQFKTEYDYVRKLMSKAITVYNWKLLEPKNLGYLVVSNWSNKGQETRSLKLTWGFRDEKTGFIYIGNDNDIFKLGESHQYFSPGYPYQSKQDIDNKLRKLGNPILQ